MLTFPFSGIGGMLSLILPFVLVIVGIRFIRRIFFTSSRDVDTTFRRPGEHLPYDDIDDITHYVAPKPSATEAEIFQLARKLKGRVTLSDIVIETELTMQEAERLIEGMIDGTHVTMEVKDNGRVVYEFPEIIDRFGDEESGRRQPH